ncbi:MAG: TlpA family protein disulfide reductase, partial [Candidatus Omnitrophica bacterium]|nr:TlpA family protein disulfide reductase [Candidatus Omnitrophota bacterium]
KNPRSGRLDFNLEWGIFHYKYLIKGRSLMKRLFFLVVLLLVLSQLLNAQSLYKEAGNFHLYSLGGEKINLSDFKSKPVILFFWTSWCPYCRQAMRLLNQSYSEIKEAGIEVLGINISESEERVNNFLKKFPVHFKVLMDKTGEVAFTYRVLGVPNYVLIDKEGKIKFQANYLPSDYRELLRD